MKKRFENELVSIKRRYLTDIYLDRLLVLWTVLAVIVVGYFGIRPLWNLSREKRITIAQMNEINDNLESNFNVLDELGQDLILTGKNIKYVYEYMPSEPDIQNYLVDYVGAISNAGFSLVRFSPKVVPIKESSVKKVFIRSRIEGGGDLVDIAKGVEDLKRVTKIKKFRFSQAKSSSKTFIDMDVEIYFIGDE